MFSIEERRRHITVAEWPGTVIWNENGSFIVQEHHTPGGRHFENIEQWFAEERARHIAWTENRRRNAGPEMEVNMEEFG